MNNQDLPVPAEYQRSSQRFCIMWEELVDRGEKAGFEIANMVRILESNGYSRTKAIEKIILDHSHLKGFSRMTIYRKLPDNMKRKYDDSTTNMLPNNSDVSNDTFEKLQEIDVNDIISTTNDEAKNPDVQLYLNALQEKNRLLTKMLEKERTLSELNREKSELSKIKEEKEKEKQELTNELNGEIPDDAFPLNFVKEYVSTKDNSKIQEYEGHLVYKGVILPLSITLNVTKQKPMSIVLDNDKFKVLNKTLLMDDKSKK